MMTLCSSTFLHTINIDSLTTCVRWNISETFLSYNHMWVVNYATDGQHQRNQILSCLYFVSFNSVHRLIRRRGGNVADEFDDLSAETPDGDARAKAERQAARKALLAELPALAKTAPERWLEDAPVNALAWLLISKDGTAKLEKLLREAKEANKSFPLQQVRSAVKAAAKRAKKGRRFPPKTR